MASPTTRHQIWGDVDSSVEQTQSHENEGTSHEDSLRTERRLEIQRKLRDVVQIEESVTSSKEESSNDNKEEKVDVNAVRMKIMDMKERAKLGSSSGPEASPDADAGENAAAVNNNAGDGVEDNQEDAEEEGRVPLPGVWSKGSAQHAEGCCRPCHYYQTRTGCMNAAECTFCHLDHPKRTRPRPCKSKRDKCKRLAGMLDMVFATQPEQFQEAVEAFSKEKGYLSTVVKSKVRHLQETHSKQLMSL